MTAVPKFIKIQDIPVLLEKWRFDGMAGPSVVFLSENVAGMDDDALLALLRQEGFLESEGRVTISRDATHTFVNFGFK